MSKKNLKDWLYVGVQTFLLIAYLLLPEISMGPLHLYFNQVGGLVVFGGLALSIIALVQLRRNLTPFPTPVKRGYLVREGVYSCIRHPVYTGVLLILAGYALYSGDWMKLLVTLVLLGWFYLKTLYEEQQLIAQYTAYPEYKRVAGRFLPSLKCLKF